jgi:membrane protease YdiL (CAAX protease family)
MATTTTTAPSRPVARWRPGPSVAVTLVALLLGQGIALLAMSGFGGRDGVSTTSAIGLLLADLAFLAVVLLYARRGAQRVTGATLGLRRTRFWPAVGWAVAAYLTMLGIGVLWTLLVGTGEDPAVGSPLLTETTASVALVFLAIAVTAPIVEEIVFRGYLFAALTRWRGPWPAAAITGVLFGAAHLAVHPPEALLPIAVLGFALCLVYWFTGSLLPCIGIHAANNAMVVGLELGWTWQVPLGIAGAVIVALLAVAPFAQARAPQLAQAGA